MSKSNKATCIVCGKEYDVCLSCKDQNKIKPWRNITDNVNCYKIFLALTQYNNEYISKDEAKKQLDGIVYNKAELKESVQAKIDEIINTTELTKKTNKATYKVDVKNDCE